SCSKVRLTIELKQETLTNPSTCWPSCRSGLRQKSGSEVRLTIELKQGNSGEFHFVRLAV
ncbi:MAG: hypothetical protein QGG36_29685, partial [Pirellulaceae bacterium]|nr:hypothetical protein [Pirellulaceae bacterium]